MHKTHVYLIPGMFGFGKLAGYDYFSHFEDALATRFADSGVPLHMEVIPTPPTASIRRRASVVAADVARTAGHDAGPIYLVGHSTGGLDSRLLVSPGASLHLPPEQLGWVDRVRGIVTVNTPHYGTPLAGYFSTVSGTRLLYALSLLTVTSLSIGRLPLTAFSNILAAVGAIDDKLGVNIHLVDQLTEYMLRFVGEHGREEVHGYLNNVRDDQGGIIQLMPESMDVFNAAVSDSPDVRYASVITAAPPPQSLRLASSIRSPYAALSAAMYSTVYTIASRHNRRYDYAGLSPTENQLIRSAVGREPSPNMVDGIVPTMSMVWRDLIWCGEADHLDVVGHFADDHRPPVHVDWLASGAHFTRRRFASMIDAVSRFILQEHATQPADSSHNGTFRVN